MIQLAEQTATVATDQEIISAPRQVFLFSGHMIDAADRSPARFPSDKEPLATAAMRNCCSTVDYQAQAPMIRSSGACGGDLLFAEACWQRGITRRDLLAIRGRRVPRRVRRFRWRTLAGEVFWGQRARPGLAYNAARAGTALRRRSVCRSQPMDSRSSARLWNRESEIYLPVGSPSG